MPDPFDAIAESPAEGAASPGGNGPFDADIQRLRLRPGDVVTLRVPDTVPRSVYPDIQRALGRALPEGVTGIMLASGMELERITGPAAADVAAMLCDALEALAEGGRADPDAALAGAERAEKLIQRALRRVEAGPVALVLDDASEEDLVAAYEAAALLADHLPADIPSGAAVVRYDADRETGRWTAAVVGAARGDGDTPADAVNALLRALYDAARTLSQLSMTPALAHVALRMDAAKRLRE